jgi:cell division protease FtsH
MTREELLARIDILLGGRVAEEVVFNEVSTGAQDDLQKATDIAKRMVMEYGMSESCGPRTFSNERASFIQSAAGPMGFQKEFSEATAEKIDQEVNKILLDAYVRVQKLITQKKDLLIHVSAILTEKEVVEGKDLTEMIKAFENPEVVKVAEQTRFHQEISPKTELEAKTSQPAPEAQRNSESQASRVGEETQTSELPC